jgi:16S rRNA (guanine1207-N2)-methyltransferase
VGKQRPPRRRPESAEVEPESALRVPRAEQLLIDACADIEADCILSTSLGRAQFAAATARRLPRSQVVCHFLDLYDSEQALDATAGQGINLAIVCSADFPEGHCDVAAIPVSKFGEAELTRDILQSAYTRLIDGGRLIAAVDNPDDTWLHAELRKLFAKVTRDPVRRGVVYSGIRHGDLKRPRDFRSEFAFRDGGHLVKLVTRPGVFSHRQLDLGARALLEAMTVEAGDRVLDVGCGSGAVGLAAALRADNVHVTAIDSNARAVECTRVGAVLNGIGDRIDVIPDAHGRAPDPGTYDVVVGNPPYYSHYQIAEIFVQAARRALKPGGRVRLVTKKDDWHRARLGQLFDQVESTSVRGYRVVNAVQR